MRLMNQNFQNLPPLGQYIKTKLALKRKKEGKIWTQNELARRAEMSSGGISQIINGHVEPHAENLKKIARALGVDSSEILKIVGIVEQSIGNLDSELVFYMRTINNLDEPYKHMGIEFVKSIAQTLRKEQQQASLKMSDVMHLDELSEFFAIQREFKRLFPDDFERISDQVRHSLSGASGDASGARGKREDAGV